MVRQSFNVENYWKVIVWWTLDYGFFFPISKELESIGMSHRDIRQILSEMKEGKAKAVTCSNPHYRTSIVIFNRHRSKKDYINSIVHEAEHVKQAMLEAYDVSDSGEPPAYTVGYLVGRMYEVFGRFCSQ